MSSPSRTNAASKAGKPRESTFVCTISLADADRAEWSSSWVRRKLSCVLWIPIVLPTRTAAERAWIGAPVLWRPTLEQEAGSAERVGGDGAVMQDEGCAGWAVGVEAVEDAATEIAHQARNPAAAEQPARIAHRILAVDASPI